MKSQILLRKTLDKTKKFLHKTFQNLKSFLFGGYHKLPNAHFVNPFFNTCNGSRRMQELDDFYRCFSDQWESNHDVLEKRKNNSTLSPKVQMIEDGECSQSHSNISTTEKSSESFQKESGKEKNKELENLEGRKAKLCTDTANGGTNSLAQKMKEFEMLDVDDVDHLLDIEEVLHYYSRLKCPVYLELVDKFFMDMYSEFLLPLPQPSVSVNSSMRRLGPLKL